MVGKTVAAALAVSAIGLVGAMPAYAATQQYPDNTVNAMNSNYSTTIDPDSAVRSNPYTEKGGVYWYTTALDSMTINCYEHGTHLNDGHYSTDVWYHITYLKDPAHTTLNDGWSWAGNVNTRHEMPSGLPKC